MLLLVRLARDEFWNERIMRVRDSRRVSVFKAGENNLLEFPSLVLNESNRERESCGKRERVKGTLKDFASLALELL